tara:strand:- start:5963 stop:6883 length:921 start_codon:yes stop_codon:yes gene_type:complete
MPVPFDAKTIEYYITDEGRKVRGRTNPETWQFVKNRYVVLRDFLPKEMIRFAMDTWKADEQNGNLYTHHEKKDITYKNPESSKGKSKGGYCTPWGVALHGFIHNKLKDYIDLDLRETYSFSRRYDRGSYLGSHTDRPSCEVSATLCLDYQTDDSKPWKIWVRNDKNYAKVSAETVKNESQDLNHRERLKNNCKSISLEPGDILLYQGPNIPHWRDYLLGEYSYHIFVHFFNATSKMNQIDEFVTGYNHDVETAQQKFALELDGRPNRWIKNQTSEEFNAFDDKYYKTDYSEMVNNYDDWQLVEKKK